MTHPQPPVDPYADPDAHPWAPGTTGPGGPAGPWATGPTGAPGLSWAPGQPVATGPVGVGIEDVTRYAWSRFQLFAGSLVLGLLSWLGIVLAVATVLAVLWVVVMVDVTSGSSSGGATSVLLGLLFALAVVALVTVSVLMQGASVRAAVEVTSGRGVTVGTFFRMDLVGSVLVTGFLVLGLQLVGMLLCYLPALVLAFYGQFTFVFLIDKGLGPVESLRSSFRLVHRNVSPTLMFFVVAMVANQIGAAVLGIGVLVTVPVVAIGQVYLFRRLLGEPVA